MLARYERNRAAEDLATEVQTMAYRILPFQNKAHAEARECSVY